MRPPRVPLAARLLLPLAPLAVACVDTYSQDPKVAAGYAGAAAGIAVAQAVAASRASDAPVAESAGGPAATLRALRSYTVGAINRVRADHSLAPLTPSAPLDEFAQRGSEWLEDDHQPHHHLLSDARCTRCGENQGSPHGEPAAPAEVQIDAAIRKMMADEGEPSSNLLSPSWRFIGVGITGPGAAMFLTLDFAEVAL